MDFYSMLSAKKYVSRQYCIEDIVDIDNRDTKKDVLSKLLSRFGRLLDIKVLSRTSGIENISFWVSRFCLVIVSVEVPYVHDSINVQIHSDEFNKTNYFYRLPQYYYLVINATSTYKVDIDCMPGQYIDEDDLLSTQYSLSPGARFTALLCILDKERVSKPISQNRKYILIGSYIREWLVFKNNVKIKDVYHVDRITSRQVSKHYYLNEKNIKITNDTPISEYSDIIASLMKSKVSDDNVRDDRYLMQALRWPLGKSTLLFFKLWYSTDRFYCKRNIHSLASILKSITGKNVTKDCELGDILLATFGIVRKQAAKLGMDCNQISFKNLWKDIALIQLARYEKIKSRQNNIKMRTAYNLEYQYVPINPWMVDISREVESWEELRLNLLDKDRWGHDWPTPYK